MNQARTPAATTAPADPEVEFIDIDDTGNGADGSAGGGAGGEAGGGYAWEEEYKRSWEGIREDEAGSLASTVANLQLQKKRRRRLRDTESVQRGIIRHLFLILDTSSAMTDKDLRPSRMELALSTAEAFILEYFDQNPLSQLGILVTRDGLAEKISELGGNPLDHIRTLKNKRNTNARGEPSLQNAMEIAMNALGHAPAHGTREVLLVFGSLTSCDPGNIQLTIQAAKAKSVRCSMVHLAAEVRVFRELCTTTGGTFSVAMNEAHFRDLLFETIPPPPLPAGQTRAANLILMGFPKKITATIPTVCACHNKFTFEGYLCPRCKAKICELPTDCNICALTLVSSPHLARSYHHLFPVANYREATVAELPDEPFCYSCTKPFESSAGQLTSATKHGPPVTTAPAPHVPAVGSTAIDAGTSRYICPKCRHQFCLECDLFIHDILRNCPGCCTTQ